MHAKSLTALLEVIPRYPQAPDLFRWLKQMSQLSDSPGVHGAVLAGFQSPSLPFAFAAGYQSALRLLFGTNLSCFCVTEKGGNRPSTITTSLTPSVGTNLVCRCAPNTICLLFLQMVIY